MAGPDLTSAILATVPAGPFRRAAVARPGSKKQVDGSLTNVVVYALARGRLGV
jgi:hypothetical protein